MKTSTFRSSCLLAPLLAALVLPTSVRAQGAEPDLQEDELDAGDADTGEVVVRAQSEAERVAAGADSVRVVDAETARAQSADLGAVMSRSEGVSVQRSGGLGSDTRLCLHGICDAGVRYFVDGVPLELAGFGMGVASVPVNLIERIETYRGAVPVRLGTDALGGVIDLVRPQSFYGRHAAASLQVGSWGTYRLFADAGVRHDESGFYAGASAFYDHADNDYFIDVTVPGALGRPEPRRVRRFHDAYEAYGISLETGVTAVPWADRLTLRGFVSEYDRDLQNNPVMKVPYGEIVYGEVSWGLLARYQHTITDDLRIDAYVGYSRRDITFTDAAEWRYDWLGRRTVRAPAERGTRAQDQVVSEDALPARLTLSWQIAPEHAVHLNVTPTFTTRSGEERRPTNPGGRDPLSAERDLFTIVSGLAYDLSLWGDVLVSSTFVKSYGYLAIGEEIIGTRSELHRRESHDVGAGEALRVRIAEPLFVRATYEYATRLPAVYEVFGDGVLVASNLDLVPERSHNATLELALDRLETPIGRLDATVAGFVRWRENLIAALPGQMTVQHVNIGEALAIGGEASARWTSPGQWVALHANATYLDDRNQSDEGPYRPYRGDRIPNRPFLFANFGADLRVGDLLSRGDSLTLSWRARFVERFARGWESAGSAATKDWIPTQLGQDLALTYVLGGAPRLAVSVDVTNFTDEPLYDLFGVQRPGRSGYVKVTVEY